MSSSGFRLFLLLGSVVLLLLAIGRVDRVVPRGSRVEAWIQRWAATGQALVVVLGLLVAVQAMYGDDAATWRWLTIGVFIIAFWSSRRSLTDWANGVMLRSEGTLTPGGRIGVDTGRGRIRRLGLRSAEVEAEDGRVLRLPYTGLAAAAIEINPQEVAARSHTFGVEVTEVDDAAALSDRMTTEALLSPWSSAQPPPSVRLLERGEGVMRFEVTVYPIDPAFVSKIESAVRASVGAPA
ncbi:MAG: mechanosensitive ion channel [Gemmatimonadota bacterium]|nr:mechanosensitive ion channel [Gemmatimonadota bacterium]